MPFQGPPNGEYKKTKNGNLMHFYCGWQIIAFPHGDGFKISIRAPTGQQAFEDQVFATVETAFAYAVESVIDPRGMAAAKAATSAVEKEARHQERVRQRSENAAIEARRQEALDQHMKDVRCQQQTFERWKAKLAALGLPCATWHDLVKLLHPDSGGDYTPARKDQLLKVMALRDELKADSEAIAAIAALKAFGNPD